MEKGNRKEAARNRNLGLLYLLEILWEETDENHSLTKTEILDRLSRVDAEVSEQTLTKNIEKLNDFFYLTQQTMHIEGTEIKNGLPKNYSLIDRGYDLFAPQDLKLMEGAIHNAHEITEEKSEELISKLKKLTSSRYAGLLNEEDRVHLPAKSANAEASYNLEDISDGIMQNRKIRFRYFKDKGPEEGEEYEVNPWDVKTYNGFLYLYCCRSGAEFMLQLRVDRMSDTEVLDEERDPRPDWAGSRDTMDPVIGGETMTVTLEGRDQGSNRRKVREQFGSSVASLDSDPDRALFVARVNTAVDRQFIGWVASNSSWIEVTAPEKAVDRMNSISWKMASRYLFGRTL